MNPATTWQLADYEGERNRLVIDGDGKLIADCSAPCSDDHGLPEDYEKNARLIAAAPELLAACEAGLRLAAQCNEVGGETAWQKMFRATIQATALPSKI